MSRKSRAAQTRVKDPLTSTCQTSMYLLRKTWMSCDQLLRHILRSFLEQFQFPKQVVVWTVEAAVDPFPSLKSLQLQVTVVTEFFKIICTYDTMYSWILIRWNPAVGIWKSNQCHDNKSSIRFECYLSFNAKGLVCRLTSLWIQYLFHFRAIFVFYFLIN